MFLKEESILWGFSVLYQQACTFSSNIKLMFDASVWMGYVQFGVFPKLKLESTFFPLIQETIWPNYAITKTLKIKTHVNWIGEGPVHLSRG